MSRREESLASVDGNAERRRVEGLAVRRRARRLLTPQQEEDALAEALAALRAAIRALPRGEEALVAVSRELDGIGGDHATGVQGAARAGDRLDTIWEKVKAVTGLETDTATLVDPLRRIAALFGVALG